MRFDTDGAILFDTQTDISRLHPLTGDITPLNVPGLSSPRGFVVESNGNLLIANNNAISRFSRSTHTTSTLTTGTFFGPSGIARSAGGRVFATEFFEDLWEISPTTGAKSHVTGFDLTVPGGIAVRTDGDLVVFNFNPKVVYRINPNTGSTSLLTSDLPTFGRDFALDANNNMWLTSTDGIYRYDSTGGSRTLVGTGGTFFSPEAIVVVPQNWSPPAVPEPATLTLALIGVVGLTCRRRR